jgi:MFS family permease
VTTGGVRASRFVGRNVLGARRKGAAGETGMLRLLDLHAASCAGDTLVALGLAGTIFFSVPAGEARGRVALYLVITMLPFALLAPVVGPVLDRFRHGRRYALATTMLGRAFLAYMISEHLNGFTLYPAAFGMLVLSRAYGVARSAAVPRVLPAGLGLSEAGARASVFGTFAGLAVLPIGLLAGALGPEWPLRLSIIAFLFGMVTALRLPPRADSDPPEAVPRPLQRPGHKGAKVLSGRIVVAALAGSASLRALYGFLTLYLAFSIKAKQLPLKIFGWTPSEQLAIVIVAGALAFGSFLATAIGTRLRIHRPALLQALGMVVVAVVAVIAATQASLSAVAVLCLATAVASGLAKLSIDAVIQERVDEHERASAFAHSETLLMVAWVAGAAIGLIPFGGRWGVGIAAVYAVLVALRAIVAALRLRKERLHGAPVIADEATAATRPLADATTQPRPRRPASTSPADSDATTQRVPAGRPSRWRRQRGAPPAPRPAAASQTPPPRRSAQPAPATKRMPVDTTAPVSPAPDDDHLTPPGYTLYRPSSPDPTARLDDEEFDR